jgi:hypothetical protein
MVGEAVSSPIDIHRREVAIIIRPEPLSPHDSLESMSSYKRAKSTVKEGSIPPVPHPLHLQYWTNQVISSKILKILLDGSAAVMVPRSGTITGNAQQLEPKPKRGA